MTKLRHDHICAVTRAQNLLETAVDVKGNAKLSKSIRGDIVLLTQLRQILFHIVENPTLPFIESAEPTKAPFLDALDAELEAEIGPIEKEPNAAF